MQFITAKVQVSRNPAEVNPFYLVGVVSTGAKCGSADYAGIYVPVQSYWYWINLVADARKEVTFDHRKVVKQN